MKRWKAFSAGMMIVFLGAVCHAQTATAPQPAKAVVKPVVKQITPAAKIDVNSASQAELEKLPGIGPAMAKKIIAGRPYASSADLAKSGVPAKTLGKITPLISVGAVPATPKKAVTPVPPLPKTPKALPAAAAGKSVKTVPATPPPAGKNMVWVNKESKVYHKPGDRWYGKTKQGSYMTESEAIKAGYRESKVQTK
jgi:hypothetical protein